MGVISASNTTQFKSASFIYSKVKRFLKSYDFANLIDDGEFPIYAKEALRSIGIGAYMESQAIMPVEGYKACLPLNFSKLDVAYRCGEGSSPKKAEKHLQNSFSFETDITSGVYLEGTALDIETCYENNTQVIERIEVKSYVTEEKGSIFTFGRIIPLRLSPNVGPNDCTENCKNVMNDSPYEISINNGYIYTNFNEDSIYIKYYGFPMSEDGDVLIPDVEEIEKAIEWYIIYQILMSHWFNSSVPDIQNKWQKAEQQYQFYRAQAVHYTKLPHFSELVNAIRRTRSMNKMNYFTQEQGQRNSQRR